jgi:hypothetical protein
MQGTTLTVRDLRRRWKPIKDQLPANNSTAIRFHRACSWLAKTEALANDEEADLVLINQWIALNALYGQWNAQHSEPLPDRQCYKAFMDQILRIDVTGYIAAALTDNRPLVLAILEDEYLAKFFWQSPTAETRRSARNVKHRAQSWFFEKNWTVTLDHLLDRIYLLRCQLVHGAATCGGKLNRVSLRRVSGMLEHLLKAILLVVIDHGAEEDWGELCYPPLEYGDVVSESNRKRPLPR